MMNSSVQTVTRSGVANGKAVNCERCWTDGRRITPARQRVKQDGRELCDACVVAEAYEREECEPIFVRAAQLPPPRGAVMEERKCSVTGCGTKLAKNNKSGRCTPHFYVPKGERGGAEARLPARNDLASPGRQCEGCGAKLHALQKGEVCKECRSQLAKAAPKKRGRKPKHSAAVGATAPVSTSELIGGVKFARLGAEEFPLPVMAQLEGLDRELERTPAGKVLVLFAPASLGLQKFAARVRWYCRTRKIKAVTRQDVKRKAVAVFKK